MSALWTAVELLGSGGDRASHDTPKQNIPRPPLQLRGLGTNLAAFFDHNELARDEDEDHQIYLDGARAKVVDYLVAVFSCLSDADNSEDRLSLFGESSSVKI